MNRNALRQHGWSNPQNLPARPFRCGYCGDRVASEKGYRLAANRDGSGSQVGAVYICPHCNFPSLFMPDGAQYPGESVGTDVQHVPDDVAALFAEARRCATEACNTASVLVCRKILMNLAVGLGAKPNLPFIAYVEYLATQGYVPPNGKHWVDHIRRRGNEATHEIVLMGPDQAKELLLFIEMLLRFIYEFPALVPKDGQ